MPRGYLNSNILTEEQRKLILQLPPSNSRPVTITLPDGSNLLVRVYLDDTGPYIKLDNLEYGNALGQIPEHIFSRFQSFNVYTFTEDRLPGLYRFGKANARLERSGSRTHQAYYGSMNFSDIIELEKRIVLGEIVPDEYFEQAQIKPSLKSLREVWREAKLIARLWLKQRYIAARHSLGSK
ncbi:MAG TPA: hypothetical protein VEA59_00895 [Patescibacteria group bacterium]|nr:hypothetical protein [Patescibacteria group bacterium]